MIKLKLLITLLFTVSLSIAQTDAEPEIELSTPEKVVDGRKRYFEKNGEIVSVKILGGNIFCQKYGSDYTQTIRNDYKKPKGYSFFKSLQINEKCYILFYSYDRKEGSSKLHSLELDFEKAELVSEVPKLIIDSKHRTKGFVIPHNFTETPTYVHIKFDIQVHQESGRVFVISRKVPKYDVKLKEYTNEFVQMTVLDSNLEKEFEVEEEFNLPSNTVTYYDNIIRDNGDVWQLFSGGYLDVSRGLFLMNITESGIEVSPIDFNLDPNGLFSNLRLTKGEDSKPKICGFYQDGETSPTEFFIADIAEDGVVSNFTSNLPENLEYTDGEEVSPMLFNSMVSIRSVNFDNSGYTVVMEKSYKIISTSSNGGSTTSYRSEEFIVFQVSNKGEYLWMNKLPKLTSHSRNKLYSWYREFEDDNFLYLFYPEYTKNKYNSPDSKKNKNKDTYYWNRGGLACYKVSKESGDAKRYIMVDPEDKNGSRFKQMDYHKLIQLNESEFLVQFYYFPKKDIFMKFKLN